ncbi:MAG TPA: SigB/SigF/SigG family RNA polymerase sigma factor [Acidimicrobiales bacterium]|nr:SigB/SigF/SigG family RNA polymerase sigma factor [Acidimicrobiales bacterium]
MSHLHASRDAADVTLEQRFHEFRRTGERAIRNELVEAHRGLAARIANDYRGRGVELDDLVQIAMLGILKAVERFDPARGIPFSSFASRTINGEIKRYFRDRTWAVRPPRSTQERHLDLRRATSALSARLGRPPTVPELAAEVGISDDEVLEALEAGAAYRATSLDARRPGDEEGTSLAERLPGAESPNQPVELRMLVAQLLGTLPRREAEIVRLRFYDELTQSEIAERLGISQMHVSRLIRRCLLELRQALDR